MHRIAILFNHEALKPLRFLIVGGAATGVHLIVAGALLVNSPDMSPYLANIIAFLTAFLVSFYGHRHLTFQTAGSVWRFFLVAIAGFITNNAILAASLSLNASPFAAVTIATACVPLLTYLASALWAFKVKEN